MKAYNPNSHGDGNLGFQIAPMIDVVFVIMLFFMVMAGAVKVERELNQRLPGTVDSSKSVEFTDEVVINIAENGEVLLNDEPMDAKGGHQMPRLTGALMRLKQSADAAKSPTLVTVLSEPEAKYARTVDVLDALAAAEITNVTFTVAEEEE
ncbi:ExbD/TolR family protein [Verrucomicrobium spinosum]|uniref:ExbD/TolR family protein n=2 Tax=Verrucomicrobium spinosum TaxID=2736 RepID=UPI0001745137|nr:biopolymer transporter ExbD [Verrucomicrobium spinosum]